VRAVVHAGRVLLRNRSEVLAGRLNYLVRGSVRRVFGMVVGFVGDVVAVVHRESES